MSLRRYQTFLTVLAVMIIGLMALGAGVRTMNAGLSCPDWPLCFGKVIPDFHVGVWFEFVHRAYAGVVAILFAAALVIAIRSKDMPKSTRTAAKFGLGFLAAQIIMGGLTVLLLVKAVIVTTHLLLATLFLCCVLWMLFGVRAANAAKAMAANAATSNPMQRTWPLAWFLPVLVFLQISIGGLVASTYAGSVCVDWPLCNGQWVPTWKGAIGLQVIHRFMAYGLTVWFVGLAIRAWRLHRKSGVEKTSTLTRSYYLAGALVVLQTCVGIINLVTFIPPHVTVLHQTLAMLLLATALKISFELKRGAENLVADPAPLS